MIWILPSAVRHTAVTLLTERTMSSGLIICGIIWVIYAEQMVQRPLNYAIVDEVDSILVDEARTPLIISGPV